MTTDNSERTVNGHRIPTGADVEAARAIVERVALRTPVQSSRFLTDALGSKVVLKCENLQRTGSYKLRGATNRLANLSPEEQRAGVVAASAGNHAQGVASGAARLGIRATIFMPIGAPLPKMQATKDYGATVVLSGHSVAEALEAASDFAESTGAVFVHPYEHPDIIAGQGTVLAELLEQQPDVDQIVVPVGGGGLISGVAIAAKAASESLGRKIRVIGVQVENAAAYRPSIEAGEPVTIEHRHTIADGIHVDRPGELNLAIVRDLVDDFVTVSDDEAAGALLAILERCKMVVEPSGAVGVAAILQGRIPQSEGATAVLLSGGNIDPLMLERIVARGLQNASRFLHIGIMLPDRPGQLARIANIVSEAQANVVEVMHTRGASGLEISEVELDISIETRGTEHAEAVLRALRTAGYAPRVKR